MRSKRSIVGLVLFVVALGLVGAGCGGGDDSGSSIGPAAAANDDASSADDASADDTSAADDAAADSNEATDDADSGSDSKVVSTGDTPPQLGQGAWTGTVHFEVSGDVDLTEDLPGNAITSGEFSLLTFAATDGHAGSQIAFTAGSHEEAAVFVSSEGFTGGGEIGKECSLSTSTNTDTAVEGTFSCKDAQGVKATSLDDVHVDIEGTFTLARP